MPRSPIAVGAGRAQALDSFSLTVLECGYLPIAAASLQIWRRKHETTELAHLDAFADIGEAMADDVPLSPMESAG